MEFWRLLLEADWQVFASTNLPMWACTQQACCRGMVIWTILHDLAVSPVDALRRMLPPDLWCIVSAHEVVLTHPDRSGLASQSFLQQSICCSSS